VILTYGLIPVQIYILEKKLKMRNIIIKLQLDSVIEVNLTLI